MKMLTFVTVFLLLSGALAESNFTVINRSRSQDKFDAIIEYLYAEKAYGEKVDEELVTALQDASVVGIRMENGITGIYIEDQAYFVSKDLSEQLNTEDPAPLFSRGETAGRPSTTYIMTSSVGENQSGEYHLNDTILFTAVEKPEYSGNLLEMEIRYPGGIAGKHNMTDMQNAQYFYAWETKGLDESKIRDDYFVNLNIYDKTGKFIVTANNLVSFKIKVAADSSSSTDNSGSDNTNSSSSSSNNSSSNSSGSSNSSSSNNSGSSNSNNNSNSSNSNSNSGSSNSNSSANSGNSSSSSNSGSSGGLISSGVNTHYENPYGSFQKSTGFQQSTGDFQSSVSFQQAATDMGGGGGSSDSGSSSTPNTPTTTTPPNTPTTTNTNGSDTGSSNTTGGVVVTPGTTPPTTGSTTGTTTNSDTGATTNTGSGDTGATTNTGSGDTGGYNTTPTPINDDTGDTTPVYDQ